jgi:hypothetical protein
MLGDSILQFVAECAWQKKNSFSQIGEEKKLIKIIIENFAQNLRKTISSVNKVMCKKDLHIVKCNVFKVPKV